MESYQPESYAFKAWLFADLRCSQSSIQTSADGSHLRWAFSQRSAATSTYLGSGDDVFFFAAFAYLVQLGSTWFNLVLGRFQPFPAGFEFQDTDGELTPMELGGVVATWLMLWRVFQ